jgi:hypothetical protein
MENPNGLTSREKVPNFIQEQNKKGENSNNVATILTIILLVFLLPVGIIVMWIWPKWKIWIKLLVSFILTLPFLLIFVASTLFSRPPDIPTTPEEVTSLPRVPTTTETVQRSRDTTRINDMDALSEAVSLAVSEGEISLVSTESCNTCDPNTGTVAIDGKKGWIKFDIPEGKTGLVKYIPRLPLDQVNNDRYVYTFASTSNGYEINAVLESDENSTKMELDKGNDPEVYEVGTNLNIR